MGGGKSQGEFAAGQEVNPGWRNFCRAQEERRIGRHERRHLGFVRVFPRLRQLESKDGTYLLHIFYITKLYDLQKLMSYSWLGFLKAI